MIQDFILQTASAPGTGSNVNLIAASTGRLNFSNKFATGAAAFYYMDDGTQAEWGYGTLTTGTPDVFSRDTVLGNTAGTTARLNFAGSVRIYNEIPAAQSVYKDKFGVVNLPVTAILEPSNGTSTVTVTNTGSNGANIKLVGNGSTTPSKYLRVAGGVLDVYNSAYTASILHLDDSGNITVPLAVNAASGAFTGAVTASTVTTSGAIHAASMISSGAVSGGALSGSSLSLTGNVAAGSTTGGYVCKTGSTGTFGGNVFNLYYTGSGVAVYIDTTSFGSITFTSDARYKHNIADLADNALARVLSLRPVSYRWQDKGIFKDDGLVNEGFLAQEVQAIVPSAVHDDGGENDVLSLKPVALIAVLAKAVQELAARVEALETK